MRWAIYGVAIAVVVVVASTAEAESLTDRLQRDRLTVLKVDAKAGTFQCVEHRRWTAVQNGDLRGVGTGDIVRVERHANGRARLFLLRTGAEEACGIEH